MALRNLDVAGGLRRTLIRALLFAFLVSGSGLQGAAAQDAVTPSDRVTRNVVVRAAPSTASLPLAKLLPGESLPVTGDAPGWFQVRLPDGAVGFVSKAWTQTATVPVVATGGGTWKAHVIDVGTGLAVFVEGPDFALLYDAGSQDDLADGSDNRVVSYIHAVRPNLTVLDHVILSHPHKDHLELMPDVFDAFIVKNVWDSGRVNPTAGYCRFLKAVNAEPGVLYHDALASNGTRTASFPRNICEGAVVMQQAAMMTADSVPLGAGAKMVMLHRDGQTRGDPNNNSVVVRLDLGPRRILLAGDAEGGNRIRPEDAPTSAPSANSVEGKLLDCCGPDLAADVLVVGHHGSLTSSRSTFIQAVGAKTFVISSGPHTYSKVVLPDPAIATWLGAMGAVLATNRGDEVCGEDLAKPGPDADESPGGCDNVRITITPSGVIEAIYAKPTD